eukprot:7921-Heterococcus_DN1.PRE.1
MSSDKGCSCSRCTSPLLFDTLFSHNQEAQSQAMYSCSSTILIRVPNCIDDTQYNFQFCKHCNQLLQYHVCNLVQQCVQIPAYHDTAYCAATYCQHQQLAEAEISQKLRSAIITLSSAYHMSCTAWVAALTRKTNKGY